MAYQNTVSTTPTTGAVATRAATLETPICLVRQGKQQTHSALPLFFQTNLHYGTPENFGNCVAFVYGPNSTDAAVNSNARRTWSAKAPEFSTATPDCLQQSIGLTRE
ncbi:hypothetical protein [Xanthomonas oryzae]|uniref:hypothetical protein n=1 Tax=Xanthomonas oryzae TaxID=347 RepID=UPI003DA04C8C